MILTLVFLVLAVLCYACSQLVAHSKFKWENSFTDGSSWKRKYKIDWFHSRDISFPSLGKFIQAPDNFYYRFFKIPYREAFPLSATILSFVTDFYHLSQMLFKIFLALSFVPLTGWIWAGVIWLTFGISFTIFYRILSR